MLPRRRRSGAGAEPAVGQLAVARLRPGHIDRAIDAREEAIVSYRAAVGEFAALARAYPGRVEYRRNQADAYNWLGEAVRRVGGRYAEAKAVRALVSSADLCSSGGAARPLD